MWTYGLELWSLAKPLNIKRIQSLILRKVTNAPFYVSDNTLHKDFNIHGLAIETYNKYHNRHQPHTPIH